MTSCLRSLRALRVHRIQHAHLRPVVRSAPSAFHKLYSTEAAEVENPAAKYAPKAGQLARFWKKVAIKPVDDQFHVTLDGRSMKTPDGNPLVIPASRKLLALLVAGEWEGQAKLLKSYSLPLTSIIVRSIDGLSDEATRQGVIDNLLRYVHTDSICYYQDYPDSFVKLQDEHWRPLMAWMKEEYGLDIKTTNGILSIRQPEEVVTKLRSILEDFDLITLAAFEKAVLSSKSFIVALALVRRRITVEDAAKAARLEVLHQIDRWGEVEDSHDVDREDLTRQLGAVACSLLKVAS
ncbi:ATP synthase complex assembly protein ATP12 [Spizellomyces punctatus DAOM BR117]|uniref:ATP12-domain-containing protein n=1 Tax=Spizellomyces punctatus (strain DAOM BR117) TaxID=645134 RepID=A0A0L0HQA9_SPIPD|nr:ATP synthase complex assembly protein ATP12 [Spizellomyces punctatus DAOM BR117]KND03302.1 hypothetical protein SPPG_02350 [Spizellomyces punctatus DAOM BR117]|eukprot:XP_016611341.1 hypothetical protein SPPG_02350 [Spizellomyces punctatus DAOM BR117]